MIKYLLIILLSSCTMYPPATIQLCLLASCESESANGNDNKQDEASSIEADIIP